MVVNSRSHDIARADRAADPTSCSTVMSTPPRVRTRCLILRASRSAPLGGTVTMISNPSAAAATRSAHPAEPPSASTTTRRSTGNPISLAASIPSIGAPTAATHEPAVAALADNASANVIAAWPLHPMTRPLGSPASGNIGTNASSTGRHRSRTGVIDASPNSTGPFYRTGVRSASRRGSALHGGAVERFATVESVEEGDHRSSVIGIRIGSE